MAYLCGFIYGDGSITPTSKNGLALKVSINDLDLLQEIKRELSAEHPIYDHGENKNRARYELCIGCTEICRDLIGLGIEPRKQFKEDALIVSIVPDALFGHFLRGLIDADGTVKQCRGLLRIGVTGKELVLRRIVGRLQTLGIIVGQQYRIAKVIAPRSRRDDSCYLEFFGESCLRVGEYIYNNATLFLKRKKERYDAARKHLFRRHIGIELKEAIVREHMKGVSWRQAFRAAGCKYYSYLLPGLREIESKLTQAQV